MSEGGPAEPPASPEAPSAPDVIPTTYQEIQDYFGAQGTAAPFELRRATFSRIEAITGRPLLSYVAKTHNLSPGVPAGIDDSDLVGFGDLVGAADGISADVYIESNGGSAEATERIVRLLRGRFANLRFIVGGNAYSAATLLCLAGDEILMDEMGTLGPIDPQINGVPARAILRAFEEVEARLKEEGPRALTAYMPLISKYDLHLLEICKSAEQLSRELARTWLQTYMLKCPEGDQRLDRIVEFFSDYDLHKSHGRSIDLATVRDLGLPAHATSEVAGLGALVRSLHNQYMLWFDKTPFYKLFEDARATNWGRQTQEVTIQLPLLAGPGGPTPQPGPPQRIG